MIQIPFPLHPFRIRETEGKEWIFDELRKQWVRLSPEEWVRQNILQYFLQVMNIPASLIAVEKEIKIGELRKRFDILVYKSASPWLMVECKEMNVPINEAVLKQALHYNTNLGAPFVLISNGNHSYAFELKNAKMEQLDKLPPFVIG
jgi:hypothetical protein